MRFYHVCLIYYAIQWNLDYPDTLVPEASWITG